MMRTCESGQQRAATERAAHGNAKLGTLALCALLALTSACHDADRYVLTSEDSVDVEALFALTVDGDTTLAADGFSKTRLVARVKNVTERRRSVLFVTTAGFLRVGSASDDSAVVQTDASGRASVELVSSREVTTARVVATILDVRPPLVREVRITRLPIWQPSIIQTPG